MADRLVPAGFSDREGFETDQHLAAVHHMREVLEQQLPKSPALGPARPSAKQVAAWAKVAATAQAPESDSAARHFLESHFSVWRVVDEARPQGLFTGYFEPELKGSRTQSKTCPYPVYAKPLDLVAFEGVEKSRAGAAYGK